MALARLEDMTQDNSELPRSDHLRFFFPKINAALTFDHTFSEKAFSEQLARRHKEVAHLTYSRTRVANRQWRFESIAFPSLRAGSEFARHVLGRSSTVNVNSEDRGNWESLLKKLQNINQIVVQTPSTFTSGGTATYPVVGDISKT